MLGYIRGREARAASARWNVCKTLLQTTVFWTLFLFVLPSLIYRLETAWGLDGWRWEHPANLWIGGVLFVLGGTLGISSGVTMAIIGRGTPLPADCPRELVIAGPYRYLRNPMAVAGISQGVAVGIMMGSPAVIAYALVGGPIWDIFVRPWEEADLEQRFGDAYRKYRSEVWCWIPRVRGYRATN